MTPPRVSRLIGLVRRPPATLVVVAVLLTLVGLIVAWIVGTQVLNPRHPGAILVSTAMKQGMSQNELDELTAGYYEGLLDRSTRMVSTSGVITGRWATDWTRWESQRVGAHHRQRGDFLYYELRPDLDVPEFEGRLVTNSFGMPDREYTVERPDGTRRCVLIGDSMARGLGTPFGANFESLLEDTLNTGVQLPYDHFEILNLGVEGYRITQMVDVASSKAPAFSPQCYIVVLSDLSVFRKWGHHIGQLVHDGIDLKYPYLKDLAGRAQLRPDDDPATLDAKLAPFRVEALRWALGEIRDQASSHGAGTLVLLVPTVTDPAQVSARFEGVETILTDLELPFVSLLDTFVGIGRLDDYRISEFNHHPNTAGHRLLFEHLITRLHEAPVAWQVLVGAS